MDTTPLGFPFPECDPPRVKDISDIGQLKDLAEAVDAAVQPAAAELSNVLLAPLAARMQQSAPLATSGTVINPSLDQVSFASAGMGDVAAGGIRITRRGWYLVGGYSFISIPSGTELFTRFFITQNGTPITGRSGDRSKLVSATSQNTYQSLTAQLNVGDLLRPRIGHSGPGATAYSTQARLWALLLLAT